MKSLNYLYEQQVEWLPLVSLVLLPMMVLCRLNFSVTDFVLDDEQYLFADTRQRIATVRRRRKKDYSIS
jgi:hypothetical protein